MCTMCTMSIFRRNVWKNKRKFVSLQTANMLRNHVFPPIRMPMLTAAQIAKIRQKEAATPDALKRNPLSNYFEGYFFVTLNTRGEAPILSEVVGKVGAP